MDFRVYYDVVGGGGRGCGWSGGLKGRLKGVANTGKGCIFDGRIEHSFIDSANRNKGSFMKGE